MSAVATTYPQISEGMAALSSLYAAARNGTAASDLKRTAKDAYVFSGMALRITVGDPDDVQMLVSFSDAEKALLTDANTLLGQSPQAFSLSPAMQMLLQALVAELLKKLLEG